MKNARLLRQQVSIQQLVVGSPQQLPNGAPNEVWADHLTEVSAQWITLRGRELFAAQEHHPEVRGIWRMRWRDSITAKMRVVHRGLHYDIQYVPPVDRDGKRLQMDIECSEGVSDG